MRDRLLFSIGNSFKKPARIAFLIAASLSLLLGSIYVPLTAYADSDYGFEITDNLHIGQSDLGGSDCTEQDLTNSWASVSSTNTSIPLSYKNSWNYQNDYQGQNTDIDNFFTDFRNKISSGDSGWGVIQDNDYNDEVTIVLFAPGAEFSVDDHKLDITDFGSETEFPRTLSFFRNSSAGCRFQLDTSNNGFVVSYHYNFISTYGQQFFLMATDNITYPSDYSGDHISDNFIDSDGDGLPAAQELTQGTSDNNADTDGDGLSDYIESKWNLDHDAEFCDTSTPKNCAEPHPTVKDVYVEMDWMNNDMVSPSESYKPTDTEIGLVSDAFAAKGIYFHADTGLYGGGNELTTYTKDLDLTKNPFNFHDYFDYKSDNFSSDRQGIWRYMISGYDYSQDESSSGGTYAGSDNIFVSYGLIKNDPTGFYWTNFDTAAAGTMIHEIGHSLCLSKTQLYSFQDSSCEYAGIDTGTPDPLGTNSYPNYYSSMNYSDQMGLVDYSDGSLGTPGDHDDWESIWNHMGDFTTWDYSTEVSSGASSKPTLSKGITTTQAKALKKKGLLKSSKATWHHLKVKTNISSTTALD